MDRSEVITPPKLPVRRFRDSQDWPLIRLTLVIIAVAVPLALLMIHFKKRSNQDGCILQVRNYQIAMRGYCGISNLYSGQPLRWNQIIGRGRFIENELRCPSGGRYQLATTIPEIGELVAKCGHPEHQRALAKIDTKEW
jgi:hypothetical protein